MIHDIIDQIVDRKISEYDGIENVSGVSFVEVLKLASQIKRESIGEGGVRQIAIDAENHFSNFIKELHPAYLEIYTRIKGGESTLSERESWKVISGELKERDIKNEFIKERLSPSEKDSLNALEKILRGRLNSRKKNLEKKFDAKNVCMFLDLESRANEVLYPKDFEGELLAGNTPTLLHYFCLRYCHDRGNFGVVGHLEEFGFKDIQGEPQTRNGASKRFQLDIIRGIQKDYGRIINQRVVVADSDLDKFECSTEEHQAIVRDYITSVKAYLGFGIVVEGTKEFYASKLSPEKHKELAKAIIEGNCSNNIQDIFLRDFGNNTKKIRRNLNWEDSANLTYTAMGLARNILEGEILSKSVESNVVSIFDKSVAIGRQFNLSSRRRVPFIAFPRMPNNQDGFCYA